MSLQSIENIHNISERIQEATTANENRGNLKIFLGYRAGVGKTYRMLQDGIVNKRNGVEVVIGLVETHGRIETEALVRELEVVLRIGIQYSGITIHEMDLDNLLERQPQLVLKVN